jgi:hypothetical protein
LIFILILTLTVKKHVYTHTFTHTHTHTNRIKLILSILEARASDTPPGCDITIKDLAHHECVMAAFPIHEFEELKKLTLKWLTLFSPPWKQPIGTYALYVRAVCTYILSL